MAESSKHTALVQIIIKYIGREHAHVHLGFADNQVQGWLRTAGLHPVEPTHFPGRRLMTGIWRGERETAVQPAVALATGLVTSPTQGVLR